MENLKKERRAKLIFSIGEFTYSKIRKGEVTINGIEEFLEEIKDIDKSLYNDLKISKPEIDIGKEIICECGTSLAPGSKFCVDCGSNIEEQIKRKSSEFVNCNSCGEKIVSTSKFCNCCGFKID